MSFISSELLQCEILSPKNLHLCILIRYHCCFSDTSSENSNIRCDATAEQLATVRRCHSKQPEPAGLRAETSSSITADGTWTPQATATRDHAYSSKYLNIARKVISHNSSHATIFLISHVLICLVRCAANAATEHHGRCHGSVPLGD